jgi:ankyrin repeat protein
MDSPQDSQLDFSFNFEPIPPIPKLDLNKMDSHIHQVHNQAAIHYAAQRGHSEIVKLLIDAGVDPDVKDGRGWSPLKCY